jgi:tagatose 6-phosphate kinase
VNPEPGISVLCLGTTPAVQRVMVFQRLELDAVNRAGTTLDGAAGKSVNVAKVLRALGERPLALGFLGGDRGKAVRSTLRTLGIAADFVAVDNPTRQCVTVIDQSAATQTELVEESGPVEPAAYVELLARTRRHLTHSRALVLSGTLAPGGAPDFYAECVTAGNDHGVLTVVDALGPPLTAALAARPGLVKPNHRELAATVGHDLPDECAVGAAMRQLHARGAQRVVVTAGNAAVLAFDGQEFWRVIPPRIRALNPIGSGDAFTAGMVWRLLRGDDLGEACRWGAAAGAANALTLMAGELEMSEMQRLAPQVAVEKVLLRGP